jgi:hypothetical protein
MKIASRHPARRQERTQRHGGNRQRQREGPESSLHAGRLFRVPNIPPGDIFTPPRKMKENSAGCAGLSDKL